MCGLISRNQKPLNYPQRLDSLKSLSADHVILDGEIVAFDEKGRSCLIHTFCVPRNPLAKVQELWSK
jgi:ATP-dependent DNA ligase